MRQREESVAGGLFWKLLELLGAQGVQFVVALFLARLMTPTEYGTIGLIMIFIMLANVFVQSGFATALIQAEQVEESDFGSVFWIGLAVSVPVYGLLFAVAPLIAHYYETPVLLPLLRAMGLVLFPGAVISVQTAYVSRNLQFRKLFEATMAAVILSGLVAILMAERGYGVFAMAAQQLIYYVALMAGLFIAVPFRPRGGIVLKRVEKLFSFGWKILLSGLLDTLWNNIYGLLIGKYYSKAALGGYNRAEQFPKLITSNLSAAMQSVLLPTYARRQSEKESLRDMLRDSIRLSAFVIFPMMAGMAAVGTSLIRTLLTEDWLFSVPYLRLLCLCYAFWPLHVSNLQMITALGRSDLFLKLECIKKLLGAALLVLSFRYGMMGLLIFKAVDEALCSALNAWPLGRLLGYGPGRQYRDLGPAALCSLLMGVLVYRMERLPLSAPLLLLSQLAAGIVCYGVLAALFQRDMLRYLRNFVRMRGKQA